MIRSKLTVAVGLQGFSTLPQGRYANLSWDEMMRSLSDPIYQYDAQGVPSFPQVQLSAKLSMCISERCKGILYSPETCNLHIVQHQVL